MFYTAMQHVFINQLTRIPNNIKDLLSTIHGSEKFTPHITLQKEHNHNDLIKPEKLDFLLGATITLENFRFFDVKKSLNSKKKL